MYKIHLPQNRETLIIISVGLALLFLTALTGFSLVPTLIEVYAPEPKSANQTPIDTEIVNKALEYLKATK